MSDAKLIELVEQLLNLSEDHEKRLALLEQGRSLVAVDEQDRIKIPRPEYIHEDPKPKPKPWYLQVGIWFAIACAIALGYVVYLFLKSQGFKIPHIF